MSCNLIRKWLTPIILHKIINWMRAFDWNVELVIQFGSWIRKWSQTRTRWNAWHMNVVASSSIMVMNWSGNSSRNCFWYHYWGRARRSDISQLFSLSLITIPEVFAKVHSSQFPLVSGQCFLIQLMFENGFVYFLQSKVGISLFTVSHRKSLWKYHEVCESFLFCYAVVISVQSLWMVTLKLRHVCNDL